jgi:ABC-2 type transport system ATP-binding protein
MEPIVIETNQLSKSYGEVDALRDLDLAVPAHSITGFLGPNGAGKSTTIKLLLGLIRPTGGSGQIFGLDIVRESTAIRHRVGYLAQRPSFYPNLTARETLRFVSRFFTDSARNRNARQAMEREIDEILELVGLEEKGNRPVGNFSGGEMQRLGLAQAQINRPDLLILDEPAAALDPMGRAQVLNIMEQLREKSTIFYSTHILDDVQRVSDRVAILNQGRLVADGPIEQLLLGDSGPVFELTVTGNVDGARERLAEQAWVSEINSARYNGQIRWSVAVTDAQIAQRRLLRLVLERGDVDVLSFNRTQYELEDVFMNLVREEPHG